jgi:CRP-like cAMP-binding protein
MEAAPYIWVTLGGLLMASVANRLRDGLWLAFSLVAMGVCTMLMGSATTLFAAWTFYVLQGLANVPNYVARSTIMQRNTAREMRGRVFSAFFVMRDTLFLLGSLSAGLADAYGPRPVILLIGAGWLVTGLVSLVLPGLGRASASWRRGTAVLQPAHAPTTLSAARRVTPEDVRLLKWHVPILNRLPNEEWEAQLQDATVRTASAGTVVIRQGDLSDTAYFILAGAVVAGDSAEDGSPRILEMMNAGDFFGEIAALRGVPRTANVSTSSDATLLEIPADLLRRLVDDPQMNDLFTSRMNARLARSSMVGTGHFGEKDQDALLDLRTPQPESTSIDAPRTEK